MGRAEMAKRLKVYIAGPYTKGDVAVNVANAIVVADELMTAGYTPYCPHLSHFQHLLEPRPYEDWIALDIEWVRVCDFVLRLPGESAGADGEVIEALKLGIPVVGSIAELRMHPQGGTESQR